MAPELPDRDAWFPQPDDFPRPRWDLIASWIRAMTNRKDEADLWQQAADHWLARLRRALGGDYRIAESENFYLVSALDEESRGRLMKFLEKTRASLLKVLGDAVWTTSYGKHVVLRFTDQDDYYAYVAHFYPNGEHPTSGGMCLNQGYAHVAYFEYVSMQNEQRVLVHELTHDLMGSLPLPVWLSEALAMAFEEERGPTMNRELHQSHLACWNEETIQFFWMGGSFHTVEGQAISYSLARVLLDIIHRELQPSPETFRRFVKQACRSDAGDEAARDQLQASMGDIARVFLGPGDWTPKPATWKELASRNRPELMEDEVADGEPDPSDFR
jgi:hypothetical protein